MIRTGTLALHGHGVLVKVRGTVMPDPVTGQLTTAFDQNPQLPFSELRVQLNGGSRSLITVDELVVSVSPHLIATAARISARLRYRRADERSENSHLPVPVLK